MHWKSRDVFLITWQEVENIKKCQDDMKRLLQKTNDQLAYDWLHISNDYLTIIIVIIIIIMYFAENRHYKLVYKT